MSGGAGIDDFPADGVVETTNLSGSGSYVLICEHASNFIPEEYENLGLSEDQLTSHIAWDPGALDVARQISVILDSPLIATQVSRLVYDCNRVWGAQSATPDISDGIPIPGNAGISEDEIRVRKDRYYSPFHDTLNDTITKKLDGDPDCAIVTIHSFTPIHGGIRRDLELGVLHDADNRLADAILAIADDEGDLITRRNAPYGPEDGVTHTLVEHALSRGVPNVMLEIRNDLLKDPVSRKAMAQRLSDWIRRAKAGMDVSIGDRHAGGTGAS